MPAIVKAMRMGSPLPGQGKKTEAQSMKKKARPIYL
jgi:hypothetical protein